MIQCKCLPTVATGECLFIYFCPHFYYKWADLELLSISSVCSYGVLLRGGLAVIKKMKLVLFYQFLTKVDTTDAVAVLVQTGREGTHTYCVADNSSKSAKWISNYLQAFHISIIRHIFVVGWVLIWKNGNKIRSIRALVNITYGFIEKRSMDFTNKRVWPVS